MANELNDQIEQAALAGLEELSMLEQQRAQIAAPYELAMADTQAEMDAATAVIDYAIAQAKKGVVDSVLALQRTVTGERVQAVYVSGRASWDNKGLHGYAVARPEVMQFLLYGAPSVTFRVVKEKAKPFVGGEQGA